MKTKLLFLSLLCLAVSLTIFTSCEKDDDSNPPQPDKEVFWDDTHWRMTGFRGTPKTVIDEHGWKLEFNSNGMIYYGGQNSSNGYYAKCEYDLQNRLTKSTNYFNNKIDYEVKFEYGNHTKYVAFNGIADVEGLNDWVLIKGVTAVAEDGIRCELTVDVASVTFRYTDSYKTVNDYAATYSGDFPIKVTTKYDGETNVANFKYGKDRKISEVSGTWYDNGENPPYKETYDVTSTSFMLYTMCDFRGEIRRYEYNSNGDLTKETSKYGETTYSNYKYDSQGNWIERKESYISGSYNSTETQTRTITYY